MSVAVRLRDLGTWHSGGTPPREDAEHWSGDIPWISAKDINRTELRDPTAFITRPAALAHSRLAPPGALLIIVRGMALVHGLPVVQVDREVAFNQDLRALVCTSGIEPRYAYYALLGNRASLNRHIDKAAHGTTRVTESMFSERIRVPDADVQTSVIDFLDRECERIADLQQALSDAQGRSHEWLGAIFDEETKQVPRVRLRFALRRIEQGWSPVCSDRQADGDEWGVLKLGCVNNGRFVDTHKALGTGLEPRPALEVRLGDLLMSRANTRELVGSCAVVEATRSRLMLSDLLYRLHIDKTRWNARFVAAAITAPSGRTQIKASAAGSAGSMPKLNHRSVKELTIPDVSLVDQDRVLQAVASRSAVPAALSARYADLRARLDEYRDALITEATSGALDVRAASDAEMDERVHAALEGASR